MSKVYFNDLTVEKCQQVSDIELISIEEPWSLNQIQGLLEDKSATARIGIINGEVVCYYSFYNVMGEGYINNLAVSSDFRGMGIASRMMEDMLRVAKELKIVALTLEVNVNNIVAISLYKKYGFQIEGKRLKFYGGKDDALIMWKREL